MIPIFNAILITRLMLLIHWGILSILWWLMVDPVLTCCLQRQWPLGPSQTGGGEIRQTKSYQRWVCAKIQIQHTSYLFFNWNNLELLSSSAVIYNTQVSYSYHMKIMALLEWFYYDKYNSAHSSAIWIAHVYCCFIWWTVGQHKHCQEVPLWYHYGISSTEVASRDNWMVLVNIITEVCKL